MVLSAWYKLPTPLFRCRPNPLHHLRRFVLHLQNAVRSVDAWRLLDRKLPLCEQMVGNKWLDRSTRLDYFIRWFPDGLSSRRHSNMSPIFYPSLLPLSSSYIRSQSVQTVKRSRTTFVWLFDGEERTKRIEMYVISFIPGANNRRKFLWRKRPRKAAIQAEPSRNTLDMRMIMGI